MKTTISLFFFLVFASSVFAQWTLTNGVGTANGNTLYTVGNDIYAGTDYSAYKTTNNGESWIQINNGFGTTTPKIKNFAYGNSTIWCSVDGSGLYFSTNSGNQWTREFGEEFNYPYGIICSGQSVICHSSGSSQIEYTTNRGLNWVTMDQGNPPGCSKVSFGINGSLLYAGANCDGSVFVTFLGGQSWTHIQGNLTGNSRYVNELICANNKIYIATQGGIFSSSNNGTNWVNLNTAFTSSNFLYMSVLSSNILIGTSNKIYYSSNDGAIFSDITAGLPTSPNIKKITYNNQYIFTILQSGAVYRILKSSIIGINNISSEIPAKFSLSQNYPNPFNPTTNIEFSLPEKSFVKLNLFDLTGKHILQIVNEYLSAGTFGYDFSAENLPSGTYLYKLETDKFSETKKMIVLK